MSNFHNYPTNGRSGESTLIKSTKIKSGNKEYLATNGKTFNKVYKKKLLSSNSVLNVNKTEKKDFISWIVNTLNPINHIPVINTLNKLNKGKKDSLDMIQSAIGGVIYGGGVAGIAKGLGGWFAGKLLPKNTITADNKYKKDENLIIMDNGKIIKNYKSNLLKKVNFKKENYENFTSDSNKINEFNKDSEKNLSKENIIHIKKNTHNYNEIYDKSKKLVSKTIDTKA